MVKTGVVFWAAERKALLDDFADGCRTGTLIIGQIEAYADTFGRSLNVGWKADGATLVRDRRIRRDPSEVESNVKFQWGKLCARFSSYRQHTRLTDRIFVRQGGEVSSSRIGKN